MQHIHDLGVKVGTALASIGSFIAAQVLSDAVLSEFVRLLSSSLIAALGAVIGFLVSKWLKSLDKEQADPPNVNVGSQAPKKKYNPKRRYPRRKDHDA